MRRFLVRSEHLPYPVVVAAAWSACLLLIAAAIRLVGGFVGELLVVVIPLLVAVLLAAMLMPITAFLHRRAHLPRALATLVTIFAVLGIIAGAFTLLAAQLATGLPRMADSARDGARALTDWLATGPLHFNSERLQNLLEQSRQAFAGHESSFLTGAVEAGTTAVDGFAGLLICLISLFFFLHQGHAMWRACLWLLPAAAREPAHQAARRAWRSVSVYARTQVLVALINAAGVGIGAWALDVPFAFPMAFVTFLVSFVPIVGALISGVVPTLVALVDRGPVIALAMVGIVFLVHQAEAHILQPFLMGRAVALHPLVVIVVVAAATYLFGIPGALFAVPFAAAVNSAVRYLNGYDPFPALAAGDATREGPEPPADGGEAPAQA